MLTVYSDESSFKKKITVVVIWLVALALGFLLMKIILHEETTLLTKILPIVMGVFMIAGILLRCKIARGFTLITLYGIALFPLVSNFLLEGSVILFSADRELIFTNSEILLTNVVWALLFIIPIYFLSNNKSMDIFFIKSNPKEHLFFILLAIALIFIFIQFSTLSFL
ncbi:MAG: Unknown protein [uncultured Sulfurovum sp.]|uniref:Uncharacterized protein n=1 Tax=uncultured Sulfurovum sp. TaxID=269237 RepID=A0A6S6SGU0_9BACT|nr:MAG: Unknown protein [uncultured Sulfurovum sp.]